MARSIRSNLLARFSHFKIFWFESFSKMKVKVKLLGRVRLFATPWTAAYLAPLSMGFSRQEYWSGVPFPSPADLPDPGIKPMSPAWQAILYHWATREALGSHWSGKYWVGQKFHSDFPYDLMVKPKWIFWPIQYLHYIHILKRWPWFGRADGLEDGRDWMEQDPLGQDSIMVEREW